MIGKRPLDIADDALASVRSTSNSADELARAFVAVFAVTPESPSACMLLMLSSKQQRSGYVLTGAEFGRPMLL